MKQPDLFDLEDAASAPPPGIVDPPDSAARAYAIDPSNDVVLEASAGTGKTRVLVDRYVRLIQAGVDPRHVLAITFTRKAAAEMRGRVLAELEARFAAGAIPTETWRGLRERVADIQISTIDAFCFGLLREFPLEANVDPSFDIADETEMARFTNEALDIALDEVHRLIPSDETLRLLAARVKGPVLREAISTLVDRRHVAVPAVESFVAAHPEAATEAEVAYRFTSRLSGLFESPAHWIAFFEGGPDTLEFRLLVDDISQSLGDPSAAHTRRLQQLRYRLERYFLTTAGKPRQRLASSAPTAAFPNTAARSRHQQAMAALAPGVAVELDRLDADVNALLARGLARVLRIAVRAYEHLLAEHGLLDFAAMLDRAVALLERQEEFARSRLKLQSRYHHVLVDEFQDTSRRQWRLVELLIDAWGEGAGAADAPTSIFVVGDRKQSIYRFRHAEVTLLDEAARRIGVLRGQRPVRQAITTSFRAVPELLAFVNALSSAMPGADDLEERFSYQDHDRFPVSGVSEGAKRDGEPVVGLVAESSMASCARAVAAEIERLIDRATVRDRVTGSRGVRPDDVAILFRSRAGHRYYEEALEARGIRTYVYKGLGFFDAPEVQDLQAILRFLARPESDLRAAEFLRSRVVRLSDIGLARLAPSFSAALLDAEPRALDTLDGVDRDLLERARTSAAEWLERQDAVPPSELVDQVLRDTAYAYEMGDRRFSQARENVKKVRALVRRVESRGYATLERIAAHFDTLRTGEESNAVVDASGAVNLMTIHAAKGLEFPIVFLVNLHVGSRGRTGGVSVIERGVSGSADVVFGSNESTRLEDRRDEEELRRLLYVAVTRARDRVYLAAEVDRKGQVRRAPRSLSALLPVSFLDAMAAAAAERERAEVSWAAPEGVFACRVCHVPEGETPTAFIEVRPTPGGSCSLTPLVTTAGRGPAPVVDAEATNTGLSAGGRAGSRSLGTLVHRLLAQNRDLSPDEPGAVESVIRVLRGEEAVDVVDPHELAVSALRVLAGLRRRGDLMALLDSGTCYFELPFTVDMSGLGGGLVRGVIDCLVLGRDGTPTVIEFKTGRPRPAHDEQLEIYRRAACEFLQRPDVQARIFYAE